MKLISLNIWSGRVGDLLIEFFKKHSDVDIFLLQEVCHNATDKTNWYGKNRIEIFREIKEVLPNHESFFAPALFGEWGLATFAKKTLKIEEIGDVFVHRWKDALIERDGTTIGKNLQYLRISSGGEKFTVINFHGLWNGQGKSDTEDRINQSTKIIDFIKDASDNIILAGDFNLRPDTKSLKMLEQELGLKNLILEHNITSTRTSFYDKPEKFADYILITPNIKVKKFEVLPDEVSDHSALFLEF